MTKQLKNDDLMTVTGGVSVINREVGGGIYQVIYITNPFDWAVQLGTGIVKRKKGS